MLSGGRGARTAPSGIERAGPRFGRRGCVGRIPTRLCGMATGRDGRSIVEWFWRCWGLCSRLLPLWIGGGLPGPAGSASVGGEGVVDLK